MAPATCSRCGAPFSCGRDAPGGCWCATLPALPTSSLQADAGCLCRDCLTRLAQAAALPEPGRAQ